MNRRQRALVGLVLLPWLAVGLARAGQANDAHLLRATRELSGRLERLFDDRWDRPPVAARAPAPVLETAATIRVGRTVRGDRLEARGRAWNDLGLGDEGAPRRFLSALAADLGGIALDIESRRVLLDESLYRVDRAEVDPETAQFLLLAGVHPDEPVLAHALVHLRQLERMGSDFLMETTDATLALAAWREGEANLVALRYLFDDMGIADEVLTSTTSPGDFVEGRLLPRGMSRMVGVEQEMMRFVYEDGFGIVGETFRSGGWRAVSDGMARPATTQNMLHLDQEPRRPVDVSVVPAPSSEFVRADTDRLGEQGVVALISRLTGKDSLALETAEGWASDALIRWEAGSEGVTQWVTLWADDGAAADFLYAWRRGLARRYPDGIWTERETGDLVLATGQRDLWVDVEGRKVVTWIAEPARLEPWLPAPVSP